MSLLRRIPPGPNLCAFCKYNLNPLRYSYRSCGVFALFDKHVPFEIRNQQFDHRYPHPEDGGIQFEKASINELKKRRNFKNSSEDAIEDEFQKTLERLESTYINGEPPAKEGHLPYIWFMHND